MALRLNAMLLPGEKVEPVFQTSELVYKRLLFVASHRLLSASGCKGASQVPEARRSQRASVARARTDRVLDNPSWHSEAGFDFSQAGHDLPQFRPQVALDGL